MHPSSIKNMKSDYQQKTVFVEVIILDIKLIIIW